MHILVKLFEEGLLYIKGTNDQIMPKEAKLYKCIFQELEHGKSFLQPFWDIQP